MSGFPQRVSRKALGPIYKDRAPILKNPEHYIGARTHNVAFSTLAGCSVISPLAWALIRFSGGNITVAAHAEAWAPDGGTAPIAVRAATGSYSLEYPGVVQDAEGNDAAIGFFAAQAIPQTSSPNTGSAFISLNRFVGIRLYNSSATLVDGDVFVQVW